MNVVRCANGHFFDANKYKFCPICGKAVSNENKDIENDKPEKTNMVMGMMRPLEQVIKDNMRCVNEFISEDPIDYKNTGLKNCKHKLARNFDIKVGFDEIGYVCKKCGHIAVFNRFKSKEFIKEYASSEINGSFYTFPTDKTGKNIVSFSASFFDFPHENFSFDGNSITYRHLISPRDGDMNYPSDFFDKHTVELTKKQIRKIYAYIKKTNFSVWESHEIDDAYELMVGSSSYNTFSCEFFDGSKYCCIFNSQANKAFRSLYRFLTELCNIDNSSCCWN